MESISAAWIFDIEGVVSNLILDSISDKVKAAQPVAFNTDRSISWLREKVINPLFDMIDDKEILENFVVVSENGRTWITFDKDGSQKEHKDKHVGKGLATERILEWLKEKSISPIQFIAFEDTPANIAIAEKLREKNLTFTFIFVDNKGQLKGREHPYPIVYTKII